MNNAFQQALSMFQDTPAYTNVNKLANMVGVQLPQKHIISPLPQSESPGGINSPLQPGLANYYAQNIAGDARGRVNLNRIQQQAAPKPIITPPAAKIQVAQQPVINKVALKKPTVTVAPQQQAAQVAQSQYPEFSSFTTAPIPQNLQSLIYNAAQKAGLNPAVLASLLFSEHGLQADQNKTYNRDPNTGAIIPNNYDRGIAQINSVYHPEVTDQQAFDPNFAIPFAANLLASHIKALGDINRGIAAYNVGRGGAGVKGPTPSGLGPKGQNYLNKVGRGLSPALRKKLGIIISE